MFLTVKKFFLRLFKYETSPHKLAVACCVGLFIAFTPFLGFHTLMLIGSGWVFNLNVPVLLIAGYVVNNPLTMVPIYMSGYLLGHWILHSYFKLSVFAYNPWWMQPINDFLHTNIGISDISFWAFLIGGNIIGIILAFLAYPVLHNIFKKLSTQHLAD